MSPSGLLGPRPLTVRGRLWAALAVCGLLAIHLVLAESSLVQENPTVDEVVHLPAGVTYWQKGTFRLYHHNPPLVKMWAALPLLGTGMVTEPLYENPSWRSRTGSPTTFSQSFAFLNIERYFELFQLARMVMPLFSVVGGLVVFAWSRRLYGLGAGFLSLTLWVFGPNVLAHTRLITTDMGSTALGVAATYVFWRYMGSPSRRRAAFAGFVLGLAQLTKFSMLLLYGVWPFLWLVRLTLTTPRAEWLSRIARGFAHAAIIVAVSVFTIGAGYRFEGVGIPLGRYEFASRSLTRPIGIGVNRPGSENPLLDLAWRFRVNRFRDTLLGRLPMPLPEHYLLGLDEQKLESEGIPIKYLRAREAIRNRDLTRAQAELDVPGEDVAGYSVYLNGDLRASGWWYYYLLCLVYKVPEGTWLLVGLSLIVLAAQGRSKSAWADEVALGTVPLVILFSMSFLTDINLGLRYVLAVFPYLLISAGKVVPWIEQGASAWRWPGRSLVVGALSLTMAASLWIHPHYLSYFNWAFGGPDREPARLIDSNLDWGQDLVGLREWCRKNAPGQPIGLAYFGQINPSIFTLRGDPFDWFLPPVMPGSTRPMQSPASPRLIGPARRLTPGYYAVSATLVYGLPWRLYDPTLPSAAVSEAWPPAWNAYEPHAFGYFREFRPIARVGHSIYVYKLSQEDVDRVSPRLQPPSRG